MQSGRLREDLAAGKQVERKGTYEDLPVPNVQHSNVEPGSVRANDLRRQLESSTKMTNRRHSVIAMNGCFYCRKLLEDQREGTK
jgi:hypothetical protein